MESRFILWRGCVPVCDIQPAGVSRMTIASLVLIFIVAPVVISALLVCASMVEDK